MTPVGISPANIAPVHAASVFRCLRRLDLSQQRGWGGIGRTRPVSDRPTIATGRSRTTSGERRGQD
jgi:hypothetical protein